MPSILIHLDDATFRALERIAPVRKRERADFIREAMKAAIHNHEYARMRDAYRLQPNSAAQADYWSSAEVFRL